MVQNSILTNGKVSSGDILQLTAHIAAAHLTYNKDVPTENIPGLIQSIHRTLVAINRGQAIDKITKEKITEINVPAVDPRSSITDDYLVCLDCGGKHRELIRHLRMTHNMQPHEYRTRWNLPEDYPMMAPLLQERHNHNALVRVANRRKKKETEQHG